MTIVSILMVFMFCTVLCFVEIPKMRKQKVTKELWTFVILLGLGTVLAILKILDVDIPNPTDFEAWLYSPLTGISKALLK